MGVRACPHLQGACDEGATDDNDADEDDRYDEYEAKNRCEQWRGGGGVREGRYDRCDAQILCEEDASEAEDGEEEEEVRCQ